MKLALPDVELKIVTVLDIQIHTSMICRTISVSVQT